jgi:transposase
MMVSNPGIHVLTDEQWAALEPLIDEVRPHSKVAHANLRQTIEAIFCRHQNGAKWRSLPNDLGPWWKAAQTFIRWDRAGDDLHRRHQHPRPPQGVCSGKKQP